MRYNKLIYNEQLYTNTFETSYEIDKFQNTSCILTKEEL